MSLPKDLPYTENYQKKSPLENKLLCLLKMFLLFKTKIISEGFTSFPSSITYYQTFKPKPQKLQYTAKIC